MHANVAVAAGDRQRLERLCRYCARPALAIERLEPLPDGRLLYRFKRPWRDGTTHVVFDSLEMLEKLAALVPAPKTHLVRYSGILAPAAKWRSQIVPASCSSPDSKSDSVPHSGCSPESPSSENRPTGNPFLLPSSLPPAPIHLRYYTWAELMQRVFEIDVLNALVASVT